MTCQWKHEFRIGGSGAFILTDVKISESEMMPKACRSVVMPLTKWHALG